MLKGYEGLLVSLHVCQGDLTDCITGNQIDALNQQEEHNIKNVFKSDDTFLESDVDEQLIISVPFNQRK